MNLTVKQGGFTLIELVIVIVILGILAAVAVPKFEELSDDAESATCKLNQCSIESIALKTYAQSALEGSPAFPASLAAMDVLFTSGSHPSCPSGGTYTYDAMTGSISCDKGGHDR